MKFKKCLLATTVVASMFVGAQVAQAEVSASVGIASTYLWRGYDLGSGVPAVSGDLSYSTGGFYTGIWGSSGDRGPIITGVDQLDDSGFASGAGSEYDLYIGYGMSFADEFVSVDVSLWNYNYPTGPGYTEDGETDFGDLTDLVVSIGVGPVAFTMYDNVAGAPGYAYYTLGGSVGDFSLTIGMHDGGGDETPTHINLDYAYNDNLTFTFSQFVADETPDDDLKFVVSYSLPIGE